MHIKKINKLDMRKQIKAEQKKTYVRTTTTNCLQTRT